MVQWLAAANMCLSTQSLDPFLADSERRPVIAIDLQPQMLDVLRAHGLGPLERLLPQFRQAP